MTRCPWLALGWALYGLYLIFVVISGRARRTRRNLPAALVGLAVNIAGLFLLVPRLGISGAGIALVIAYAAMLPSSTALTRSVFSVGFEWGRLARLLIVLIGVSVAGELALPTSGAAGFLLRGARLVHDPAAARRQRVLQRRGAGAGRRARRSRSAGAVAGRRDPRRLRSALGRARGVVARRGLAQTLTARRATAPRAACAR